MRMINAIRVILLKIMPQDCVNIVEIFGMPNNPHEEIEMILEEVFPKAVTSEIMKCAIESPCALIINMRMVDVGCTPEEFIFLYDLPDLI